MLHRVLILLRARLSGMWLATFAESAPLWMHSLLASALCLIVRSEVPVHSYELVALSFSAVLLTIPMLGEFGSVLRTDPAREWVEALPIRQLEVTVARVALLLTSISLLALAALLPAAIFAPSELGFLGRLGLVATGLGQAACLAALLLALQAILRGALEGLLVLLQTALVAGAIVGTIAGLRFMPELQEISLNDPRLTFYPPAWFVSADWRMLVTLAVSAVVLVFAPAPAQPIASNRKSISDRLLAPLRGIATRIWVRREERPAFDLVYDVLPREREFVIRTYPMLGIPLAFLLLGARGETGAERDIMMAVLLFTPAAYMPVLLTHIPASRTPEAGWILKTAPVPRSAIANGALKAVAIRFIFPLYILLSAVSVAFSGVEFTLRLAVPGALVSLLVMRRLFPSCATTEPLSRSLSELEHDQDLMKSMFGQAVVLPILGIVVWKFAVTPIQVAGLIVVLLVIEWIHDRYLRESLVLTTRRRFDLMFSTLMLSALAALPCVDSRLQLIETAPIETTLGSDAIPEAADVWLEMIRGAKERIHIAQFYISDRAPSRLTPILSAVEEAAGRGVQVRVLAEKQFQKTYPDVLARLGALQQIEVRLYDIKARTDGILHAKYFTVDSKTTYLGSQNFDWRSLEHIQELGVRVESKELTRAFDEVFLYDWALAGGEEMRILPAPAEPSQTIGDLVVTPVFSPKELCPREAQWDLPHILGLIDDAKSTVRIQLLNYKAKNRDRSYFGEIEQALRAAAARKVHVELLLADWSKSRGTIEGLQSLQVLPNIDIKLATLPEWSGGFIDFARVIHSKYMVVDGNAAWIGTSNWSGDYFHASRNVGLVVQGESFGKQLDEYFVAGWSSEYATLVDPCAQYEAPKRQ